MAEVIAYCPVCERRFYTLEGLKDHIWAEIQARKITVMGLQSWFDGLAPKMRAKLEKELNNEQTGSGPVSRMQRSSVDRRPYEKYVNKYAPEKARKGRGHNRGT